MSKSVFFDCFLLSEPALGCGARRHPPAPRPRRSPRTRRSSRGRGSPRRCAESPPPPASCGAVAARRGRRIRGLYHGATRLVPLYCRSEWSPLQRTDERHPHGRSVSLKLPHAGTHETLNPSRRLENVPESLCKPLEVQGRPQTPASRRRGVDHRARPEKDADENAWTQKSPTRRLRRPSDRCGQP